MAKSSVRSVRLATIGSTTIVGAGSATSAAITRALLDAIADGPTAAVMAGQNWWRWAKESTMITKAEEQVKTTITVQKWICSVCGHEERGSFGDHAAAVHYV